MALQSLSDIYKAVVSVPATAMSTPKRDATNSVLTAEMQLVALGDASGAQAGVAGNPLVVSASAGGGSANLATSQVSVAATATLIAALRAGRNAITITNTGTTAVYIGAAGVTTATGTLLPGVVGASITIPTTAAVYGISSGSAQTVSVLETY